MHQDIDHPIGTFLCTVSCMHDMAGSLVQGGECLGAAGFTMVVVTADDPG